MEKTSKIILQNIEKISKRKTASKNISSPHKLSQCMNQKLLFLGHPVVPRKYLQASNYKFVNKLSSNQVSLLFLQNL